MQPNRLLISEELTQILEKMKLASVIASQLLDLAKDINLYQTQDDYPNYLGQSSDSASMISYLTSDRLATLKETCANFDQDVWTSKRRYKARPAAIVQKILRDCRGRDIEIFANVFKSVTGLLKFEFNIVEGEDIREWYHYSRQSDSSGSLGSSCMKHDFCQPYLDIYCKNPDQIKLLLMLDNRSKLMGRALLWNTASEKIMDRIYTINDEELAYHFKMWASENGYSFKAYQRHNTTLHIVKDGKEQVSRIQFKLKNWDFEKFPYVDTFKFLNTRSGVISNYKAEGADIILMHSEGKFVPIDNLFEDFIDNCFYYHSEAATIDYLPDGVKLTRGENCRWSEFHQRYILREHAHHDEVLNDWIFGDQFKELNDMKKLHDKMKKKMCEDFDSFARFLIRKNKFDDILNSNAKDINQVMSLWKKDKKWVIAVIEGTQNATEDNVEEKQEVQAEDSSTDLATRYEEERAHIIRISGNGRVYPEIGGHSHDIIYGFGRTARHVVSHDQQNDIRNQVTYQHFQTTNASEIIAALQAEIIENIHDSLIDRQSSISESQGDQAF
jgi:hypothetical protein